MGAKKDLIQTISRQLIRILKKQERIEEISVQLDNNIVVTPTEGHTIHAIGNCSSINITELGANFGVTKSAASQIVAKLSKKGFVRKKVSAHSAKELQLELTEIGEQAFESVQKYRRQHFADIAERLGAFSLSQIATATALLEVVEDVMDGRLANR